MRCTEIFLKRKSTLSFLTPLPSFLSGAPRNGVAQKLFEGRAFPRTAKCLRGHCIARNARIDEWLNVIGRPVAMPECEVSNAPFTEITNIAQDPRFAVGHQRGVLIINEAESCR